MQALLNRLFDNRARAQVIGISFLLITAVAVIDLATGYEISFSIFYLIPISLSAWYGRKYSGLIISILSAVSWLVVDLAGDHRYSNYIIPFWNSAVRLGFFVLTSWLLATLRERIDKEAEMARIDGLTGTMNGRAFREEAYKLFGLAARHHRPIVLAYIDLDAFKTINDTSGHAEGDRVLKAVADTILKSVRGTDLVGRLGGDEFAVLLTETTDAGARTVLAKVRENLMEKTKENNWTIGLSIGVAVFPLAPKNPEEAIKLADSLMYRVKNKGKNSTLFEEFKISSEIKSM